MNGSLSAMNLLASITPLILAGGLGTRLQATIPGLPKVMVEVHGRPFLTYLLDQLHRSGFRSVLLCTGHRAGMISRGIGPVCRGLEIRYSREEEPLEIGRAHV